MRAILLAALLPACTANSPTAADRGALEARVEPRRSFVAGIDQSVERSRLALLPSSPALATARHQASALPAAEAARAYLSALRTAPRTGLRRLAVAAPGELVAADVHDLGRGPVVVKLRQRFRGLPVFRREVNVVMSGRHDLVAVSGELCPAAARSAFELDERSAIARAVDDLGGRVSRSELLETGTVSGGAGRLYRAPGCSDCRLLGEVRVDRVYYPLEERLEPAYLIELDAESDGRGPRVARTDVISAVDGTLLFRNNRLAAAEPFSYRVWADPNPPYEPEMTPYCDDGIPHPTGTPDGYLPGDTCPQSLVTLTDAGISTGDPWLADGATETRGNNVDVYFHFDLDAASNQLPDGFFPENGDFHASATGDRAFDYAYDHARAANDYYAELPPGGNEAHDPQLNAKIVQAFYVGNLLHDLTYDYGFDETAGVGQVDNYGRGGLDGDPLEIWAGATGTWAAPRADGRPSYLSLGVNAYRTATRQNDVFDLQIFAHEWMHYMQYRLVGDASGLTNHQGRSLGEGWSDFFGLLLTVRAWQADLPANTSYTGAYSLGAYGNQAYCPEPWIECVVPPAGTDQTWYRGIRRYPQTVDQGRNPLTFRLIENDLQLPPDIPLFYWNQRFDNSEEHNVGEIWAISLWECYQALLTDGARLSFAEARDRMLTYLVAGMKATPIDPTMIEARDALLAVVRASDPADYALFTAAFARRGMGAGASGPPRYAVELSAVESFQPDGPYLSFVEARLDEAGTCDGDGVLDVGEQGKLTVVIHNSGFDDLSDTRVTVLADPTFELPQGGSVTGLVSGPGQDLVVELPVQLTSVATYQEVPFVIRFEDPASGLAPAEVTTRVHVSYDVHRTAWIDNADEPVTWHDWSVGGHTGGRGGSFSSRDHRWERDGQLYRAPAGLATYDSELTSPWLAVSADQDLVLHFDHAFNLETTAGDWYGNALIEIGGPLTDGWQPVWHAPASSSPGYPSLVPETIDLGSAYAGQLVRVRFSIWFGQSLEEESSGWLVDNIQVDGLDQPPFSEIHPDGSASPSGNWPPVAKASAREEDMLVTFTDESTDSDGSIVGWSWQLGDGEIADIANPVHAYDLPGTYPITLRVVDDGGSVAIASLEVVARQELQSGEPYSGPFARGPQFFIQVPPGTRSLTFTLTGSSGSGWLELFAREGEPAVLDPIWVYDRYAGRDFSSDASPLELTIDDPGAGRWYVTVLGVADSLVATLADPPALPQAAFVHSVAGLTVRFNDTSTATLPLEGWAWDFGDGAVGNLPDPTHTYAVAGTYTVNLTVTDQLGRSDTASASMDLVEPAEACEEGCCCATAPGAPAAFAMLLIWLTRQRRQQRRPSEAA